MLQVLEDLINGRMVLIIKEVFHNLEPLVLKIILSNITILLKAQAFKPRLNLVVQVN